MSNLDHKSIAIADSYARAMLDLTEQAGNSDDVFEALREIVEQIEKDVSFATFMTSAAIDDDRRTELVEKCFRGKLPDLLVNTLQVMNRKGRCELVAAVCEQFRLALEELRREIDVQVTSAVALDDVLRAKLREVATKVAGKTARLVEKVDPSILGGLIVRIGDEKLDSSVWRQLGQVHEAFEQRASREIHGPKQYFEIAG